MDWRADGSPRQKGIEWHRRDWLADYPAHSDLFEEMPVLLDRAAVQAACADAGADGPAAERAFFAVMAWGFGNRGYGRHRVREILANTPAPRERLLGVARTLASEGPLAAYRRLAGEGDCRLAGLGPAFGTKYLYFCQPPMANPTALIHDENVSDWFTRHASLDLGCARWSDATYGGYLALMAEWAAKLDCRPDDLELRIFEETVQGQWAR